MNFDYVLISFIHKPGLPFIWNCFPQWSKQIRINNREYLCRVTKIKYYQAIAQMEEKNVACSAGVFWVGESLLIGSLRWSRHLWFYDRGRLGRVEIVTLTISSSLREFQHGAFAIKTIRARPMKTPALQAKKNDTYMYLQNCIFIKTILLRENFLQQIKILVKLWKVWTISQPFCFLLWHRPSNFPPYWVCVDLVTMSCCFQAPLQWCSGFQASFSPTSCDFLPRFFYPTERPKIKKCIWC